MAGEIGQAFVRVRPNVSGFSGETESGVRRALTGIARIAAPILGAVGAFEFGKNAVKEAAAEETALAQVRQSIKDTDRAFIQHGQNVSDILRQQARDTGFGTGEVAQAFTRLETGTQNTARSLELLGRAQDISRARHIGLAQAAQLLSRAEQGSITAVRRFGIVIPPVTANVDKLKQEHAELVRSGVKFDESSKQQFRSALATAQALDAQATKVKVLEEVQRRFSGQAKTFAEGPAGEFARLRENIAQFEASLGRDALPQINRAIEIGRVWINDLRENEDVHKAVSDGVHLFADAVNTGKQAVEFFLPPLRATIGVLREVGSFTGVGGIAAFAGGFKAVELAVSAAGAVQQRYRTIIEAGTAVERGRSGILTQEAAAYNSLTAAIERNTIATELNASGAGSVAAAEARLLPSAANAAQIFSTIEENAALASDTASEATLNLATSASDASDSFLDLGGSVTSLADHSTNLAKKLGQTTDKAIAIKGSMTGAAAAQGAYATSIAATETAQTSQIAATTGQVAALEQTATATEAGIGAQRAQTIATEAQTAATQQHIVAVTAETEALIASRAANLAAAEGSAAQAALGTVAATTQATTAASGLSATLGKVGRGLFTLAGGYRSVAAIGLAAFAFGIYKGITAESALERSTRRLGESLNELGGHLSATRALTQQYADSISNLKSDRIAIDVAKANVALAEQAARTSTAKVGSAEYLSVQTQVASAQDALRRAEEALNEERRRSSSLAIQRRQEEDKINEATQKAIGRINELRTTAAKAHEGEGTGSDFGRRVRDLANENNLTFRQAVIQDGLNRSAATFVELLKKARENTGNKEVATRIALVEGLTAALGRVPSEQRIKVIFESNAKEGLQSIISELERVRPKAEAFANVLRQERFAIQGANPELGKRIGLLTEFARQIGRVPRQREVNIALKTPKLGDAVKALAEILSNMTERAKAAGFETGKQFSDNFIQGLLGSGVIEALNALVSRAGLQLGAKAGDIADVSKQELANARQARDDTRKAIGQINQQIRDAREGVGDAQRALSDANRDLADAIRQGAVDIRNAVNQAGSNLFSIGSSLSDAIDQFLDAKDKTESALTGPQAKEAERLRNLIASGQAGPDLARRAQALASELEQGQIVEQKSVEDQKKKSRRQIADLVAEFNRGTLSIAGFNKRLAGILAADGFTYRDAGKALGLAFTDGFRAQLSGLKKQAQAIVAGGRFPGIGALAPQIISPLQVLRQSQREIADAQRRRDDASRELQKRQVELDRLEEGHSRAMLNFNRRQTQLQALMEQHLRFLRQEARKQTTAIKGIERPASDARDRRQNQRPRRRGSTAAVQGAAVGAGGG